MKTARRIGRATLLAMCLSVGWSVAAGASECKENAQRYVIQGATVYDKKSDRTWARCSVGQVWRDGIGCSGVVEVMPFDMALKTQKDGWRLPTISELKSLVVATCKKPAMNTDAFPDMDMDALFYWSSTPKDSHVWYVHFVDGKANYYNTYDYGYGRNDSLAVRLVRGGQ